MLLTKQQANKKLYYDRGGAVSKSQHDVFDFNDQCRFQRFSM